MTMFPAFFDEMNKLAADKKKSPVGSIAKIIGSGALGMGAGTAAGLLAGYGADALVHKTTGRRIPRSALLGVAPLLGAAGGIAYSVHKAREMEAVQRALKDSSDGGTR